MAELNAFWISGEMVCLGVSRAYGCCGWFEFSRDDWVRSGDGLPAVGSDDSSAGEPPVDCTDGSADGCAEFCIGFFLALQPMTLIGR